MWNRQVALYVAILVYKIFNSFRYVFLIQTSTRTYRRNPKRASITVSSLFPFDLSRFQECLLPLTFRPLSEELQTKARAVRGMFYVRVPLLLYSFMIEVLCHKLRSIKLDTHPGCRKSEDSKLPGISGNFDASLSIRLFDNNFGSDILFLNHLSKLPDAYLASVGNNLNHFGLKSKQVQTILSL